MPGYSSEATYGTITAPQAARSYATVDATIGSGSTFRSGGRTTIVAPGGAPNGTGSVAVAYRGHKGTELGGKIGVWIWNVDGSDERLNPRDTTNINARLFLGYLDGGSSGHSGSAFAKATGTRGKRIAGNNYRGLRFKVFDLTAAECTTLYNGGTGGLQMLFKSDTNEPFEIHEAFIGWSEA